MIIDTHAHYDDEAFDEDREKLLLSLPDNDIEIVVNASANLRECQATLDLIKKYPFMYGMIGVHPSETEELNEQNLKWLEEQCKADKIVAVGEIGLDYYWPEPDRDIQIKWFKEQIEMARRVNKPLNIHSRDAAKDTMDILKEHRADEIGGIIHCYSYSVEQAREYLNMGFSFGIGGVLTFKNARKLVEVVEYLPLDAVVLETDAPYLAPVPNRGKRNDSTNIKYVVSQISQIKNVPEEEVIRVTNNNAKRIYRIDANIR